MAGASWRRISFWSLNIGLAWMVFVNLFPLGVLQLYASVNEGYFEARSLGYLTNPANRLLEWGRMPGDVIFIVGGCLPFLWIAWQGLRHSRRGPTTYELPQDIAVRREAADHGGLPEGAMTAAVSTNVAVGLWLQRVSARRGVRLRRDGPASRGARAAVADGLVPLPSGPRRVDLPAGPVAVAHLIRPGAAHHALPRETRSLQRLPGEERLHDLATRQGSDPGDRSVAALRSRSLPPRHRLSRRAGLVWPLGMLLSGPVRRTLLVLLATIAVAAW